MFLVTEFNNFVIFETMMKYLVRVIYHLEVCMKTKKIWLLRAFLAMVVSGIMFFTAGSNVSATNNKYLSSLNAGAALILDADITMGTSELVAYTAKINSEAKTAAKEEKTSNLVMTKVQNTLNVRIEPKEGSAIVGKLYKDCGGELLEQKNGWTKIKSGNVIGWCNNEYLVFNQEAEALALDVGVLSAVVNAEGLSVRKEARIDAVLYGLLSKNDEVTVTEELDGWVAIDYGGDEAFVSAKYVTVEFNTDVGETVEEIKLREEAEAAEKAKLITNYGALPADTSDLELLAALIYCEAGNQTYEGKLAVGAVVMNRVRSGAYPNTIGGVIYASGQFTPALNGKVAKMIIKGAPETCFQAAEEAIGGATNVGEATHFRISGNREGIIIGAHVFW